MIHVIPLPYLYEEKYGEFILNSSTSVYADERLSGILTVFGGIIEKSCGYKLEAVITPKAAIHFLYDRHIDPEGYQIDCESDHLTVTASTLAGAFYAVQTLRQLLNADIMENAKVLTMHAVKIEDKPRYPWRGIMLDESRHFFGVDYVKKLLSVMALHKLNVFHWHLTDNEGWRIEIKKYPRLTEIGAVRKGTQYLSWGKKKAVEWQPYGGYYTQEEMKDIVRYAASLHISVIPEIDVPAHFGAALAAYPELGCRGETMETPVEHSNGQNGFRDIIACAGKQSVYQFIYDVIDEVAALFPAPYLHIGGDEAPKKEWKICPDCQKVIKDNSLKDEEELQGYFNNKIALYLQSKGKTMIGWNEILTAKNLIDSAVAQYWVPARDKNVERRLEDGKEVILSKHQAFYFDMTYAYVNLSSTYKFEPEEYNLKPLKGIKGVEGTVWTEWIRTPERLEFQLFPRMEALAETAWTPASKKCYGNFRMRLKKFVLILDRLKVSYAPESMLDTSRRKGLRIHSRYVKRDAHCEYKKAMHKSKGYK